MKKKSNRANTDQFESVNRRLDALIRILLETLYDEKKKFNDAIAVKTLHSVGLTPTEIAKILGKKGGAQAVSQYIYSKDKKSKKSINPDINNSGEKNG